MTSRQVLAVLVASAVAFVGCSDSSTPDVSGSVVDPATDAGPAIDFQLFSSDEGAGCGVYVSVPEAVVTDGTDMRDLLWRGIVENDFTECGFSDVVEVGLITVDGLDNYNQPDWSTAVEHAFYSVSGWTELVESCSVYPLDTTCASTLQTSLAE